MVFVELWNYLHDTHQVIKTGMLQTQADTINRLFWFVNASQYQQFPALLCAQAAWIFRWYLEKVLPFQEYAETDSQEIARHYQLLIRHLEQSAIVSQNIEDEFRREISRLQRKKLDRLHEVLDEYVKKDPAIRGILEYVLHAYFASKAILVDTFGNGILVPLQISVDPHTSCEHVEFWNHAVNAEMQTSADAARSVARRYLLEQFDLKIPEDIAVQCQFFNPAVSYHDTSASLLIGILIVGEVLGLAHDPATAVTGEVELFGRVLSVGNILRKIETVGQDDGIIRIVIPTANLDEIQQPVQKNQLTIIPVGTFAEAVEHYYGASQILACKRQQALTWQQVREICADITKHRMATVQGKYETKLYLQREKTRRAFEQFLHSSEKKCFVLIGKSGVGKSNFFLSLYDEFQRSQDDIHAMLMYDGANLNASITTCITQDLNNRLKPPNRQFEDIWQAINRIEGIEDRLLILYLDAINENPNAKELLRQVNELVQKPYPWLKVVCSSRPETWQTIKRGVRLAERLYYREEESETIGVELEPFFYSEQLEPFSRQELPEVYAKYQQAFNVQTPYEALQSEQRELLRDPLSLWLVAHTYQGQAIPETLKATELIEQYVQALVQSERLNQEDLRLLEIQLIPLMVKEGHYSNAITGTDIEAAGEGLYERLDSQSFLNLLDSDILVRQGEGRKQIITFKYERFYEYFVGSRLYELSQTQGDRSTFFKELICQISTVPFLWGAIKNALVRELQIDVRSFYSRKIGVQNLDFAAESLIPPSVCRLRRKQNQGFALLKALLKPRMKQAYQAYGSNAVLSLCFTDEQRVKEMIVSVLTEFGCDQPTALETLLDSLLPVKERMSRFRSLLQLFGLWTPLFHKGGLGGILHSSRGKSPLTPLYKRGEPSGSFYIRGELSHSFYQRGELSHSFYQRRELSSSFYQRRELNSYCIRNAKKITIEVASNLNMPQILQTSAMQADPTIRTVAVRYTYYLWQRNPEAGLHILECLAKSAIPGDIPHPGVFESVLGLSLLIFFDNSRNEFVLRQLQGIWRCILTKMFGIRDSNSLWRNWLRSFIRKQIISYVVSAGLHFYREMPFDTSLDLPEIEAFFRLGIREKSLYRNLIRYIDPQGEYSQEQMEKDFLATLHISNFLIRGVVTLGMVAHAVQSPLAFLPFLKKFFDEVQKTLPPSTEFLPLLDAQNVPVFDALNGVLFYEPKLDNIFDFFVYVVETYQEYYATYPKILNPQDIRYAPEARFLGPYIYHQYRRTGTVTTDWLESLISKALASNNLGFFDRLLGKELPGVGIHKRRPEIALEAVALFFKQRNLEIEQMLQSFLARLRVHYPDEVDNFLEEQEAPAEFRLQVRTSESTETIGELILNRIGYFGRDILILGSPMLRDQLIRMLAKTADCNNAKEWLHYVFRELINVIYGEEILPQTP